MDSTCVDSAIEQLLKLWKEPHLTPTVENQIKALLLELRFVKMFFSLLKKFRTADHEDTMLQMVSTLNSTAEATLEEAGKGLYEAGYFAISEIDVQDWERLASNLLKTVENLKPEFRRICVAVLHRSSLLLNQEEFFILEFMDSTLVNLKRLVSLKADMIIAPVKKQIMVLEAKLRFSRDFVDFSIRFCGRRENLRDFLTLNQDWAKNAVCLSLLYWAGGMEVDEMNSLLSDELQKIMPCHRHLEVTKMYIELLKASEPSRSDAFLMGEIVAGFVDIFSESLGKKRFMTDDIEILRDELIFLIAFLMDPPEELGRKGQNPLSKQVEAVISEVTSLIPIDSSGFHFLKKITNVKTEIRELYVEMPVSCDSNWPMTNGEGFIDFLLTNLEEMIECSPKFVLFAKHKILTVHKELKSLVLLLNDIVKLQNESEELEGLWRRTVNVAYRAQNVINSCSISDCPIWHHMICLSDVVKEIEAIKKRDIHVSEKAVISLGDYELEESTQLNQIMTFSTLALHDVAFSEKLLRRLTGLRKLRCVVSESQLYGRSNIQFPGFASLQNLASLALSTDGLIQMNVLEVIWMETFTLSVGTDLIQPQQASAMDYTPAPSMQLDHEVMIEEVEQYFTNYIVTDSLGIIANAHTVFADQEPMKAMSEPCLGLARLFSIAIDFPKTAVPAEIPSHLRVEEYPDFMEKPGKTTYESKHVIGKLFREGIKTEAEILSGGIMKMSRSFDRRKDAEAVGMVVRLLRKEARTWFNKKGGESDDVYAKASARYHVTYHPRYWVLQ
ncbi:hypothetical protein ACH5RR_036487 [Cinchona calisaya]|uniref:RNA-dependent RNA polymerase n=1 Tax=Cinchona calisaya TaxID=153742 RepID=A0ABD2Y8T3_9GENT